MKNSILFLLLTLSLSFSFISCSDDDKNENNEKQFNCFISFDTDYSSDTTIRYNDVYMEAVAKEQETLLNAYSKVLNANEEYQFVINAKDSADLKTKVADLCKEVQKNLGTDWRAYHKVYICAQKDEKNSNILCVQTYGKSDGGNDGYTPYGFAIESMQYNTGASWPNTLRYYEFEETYFYIYKLHIDTYDSRNNCNMFIRYNLNYGAGGKRIYLFAYGEQDDPGKCITDIICLDSGPTALGYDYTITYNGRKYVMSDYNSNRSADLNRGAGGDYLYLMYTTDDYDDWKLTNMQIMHYGINFDATRGSGVMDGIRTETVPMVDINGNRISDQADLNKSVGGEYIYLQTKYKK